MFEPAFRVTQSTVQLSAARPVAVKEIPALNRTIAPHDHDYFEFTVVVAGHGTHLTEGTANPLTRGSVLLLAPEEVHGYQLEPGEQLHLWNIYYLAEWLLVDLPLLWREPLLVDLFLAQELFPNSRRGRIPEFRLGEDELQAALDELAAIQLELASTVPSLIYLKSCFLKFLIQLTRAYCRRQERPQNLLFRKDVWRIIQRIDEIVQRNDRFDPGEEIRRLGITRDHGARLFREATGRSPMEYYQERRIQQACFRLLDPRSNLTEIALDLRFSDSAHFSRLFRKHRGISPSQYRVRYQAGEGA